MGLSTLKIRCQESATLLYVRTYVYWYHTKQRPGTSRSLYVAKQGVSCLARERAPCFSSYFFWKLCDLPCNRERTFASTILQAARCGKMTEARSFSNSGRQARQLSVCWLSIFCSKKESSWKEQQQRHRRDKTPAPRVDARSLVSAVHVRKGQHETRQARRKVYHTVERPNERGSSSVGLVSKLNLVVWFKYSERWSLSRPRARGMHLSLDPRHEHTGPQSFPPFRVWGGGRVHS